MRCTVKSQSLLMMLVVECHPKSNELQKHHTKLSVWGKRWQVSFSASNREVVHAGKKQSKTHLYNVERDTDGYSSREGSWSHC